MNCVVQSAGELFSSSRWISYGDGFLAPIVVEMAPCFRREFSVGEGLTKASLAVCGLGLYQAYVNGVRPTDNVLMPLFTDYNKRVLYDVIDVTEHLQEGENCIAFRLGNGFFYQECEDVWDFKTASWRGIPRLIYTLQLIYRDGHTETVVSDSQTRFSPGGVVFNCLRNGEIFDARKEPMGWQCCGFDDNEWKASVYTAPIGILHENTAPPIKECKVVKPIAVKTLENGRVLYDFGVNMSGFVRLCGKGCEGTEVIFRYGELTDEKGNLDVRQIASLVRSGDFQTDRYIFGNHEANGWSPSFTYHGFRYIEVEIRGEADLQLEAVFVHSDLRRIASFRCSEDYLNRLDRIVERSDLSNFVGIPTDCPQREKNGWLSEGWLAMERILFNYDAAKAYEKWLVDMCDAMRPNGQLPCVAPNPGWGYNWGNGVTYDYALPVTAFCIYEDNGDRSLLERIYPFVKTVVKYQENFLQDYVVSNSLPDWLSPDIFNPCPGEITCTSYFYDTCKKTARMAALVGEPETAIYYEDLAREVKEHFNATFIDPVSGKVGASENGLQTAQSVPLYYGIVSDENREKVASYLKSILPKTDGHIATGTYGTKCILEVLSINGCLEEAYEMVTKKGFPGWGFMLEKGATALWEMWNAGRDEEWYGSLNHNVYGTPSDWMYRHVAGLRQAKGSIAYQSIEFAPGLTLPISSASCERETVRGRVAIAWHKTENGAEVILTVPHNSQAKLLVPCGYTVSDGRTEYAEGEYRVILQKSGK